MPYKQDRYYRFGYEPYNFQALWQGWASPSVRASTTRALGDVTDRSEFFQVPRRKSPYWLHKRRYMKPRTFAIARRQSPYWLHKHAGPMSKTGMPLGDVAAEALIDKSNGQERTGKAKLQAAVAEDKSKKKAKTIQTVAFAVLGVGALTLLSR